MKIALAGALALIALSLALLVSLVLTDLARRYAIRNSLLDVPNDRSLHSTPIPRGGGIAIAIVSLAAIGSSALLGLLPPGAGVGLLGGGVAVALIGWWDDRLKIRASIRALIHFTAAFWLLYWVGGFTTLNFGNVIVPLGWFGNVVAAVAIVWMINLYNFMDGADGLAASEATFVAIAAGFALLWRGELGLALIALAIGGASGGFFVRNRAPAKIFLGDIGSGLLGFLFAGLALVSDKSGGLPFLAWLILLGVFVMDATITLIRRISRGERWYVAHRSHAYQRLVQSGWSHEKVTRCVLGLNLLLLGLVGMGVLVPGFLIISFGAAIVLLGLIYVRIEQFAPFPHPYQRVPK